MANCADTLSQLTADLLKFTAAETRYQEFLGGVGANKGVAVAAAATKTTAVPATKTTTVDGRQKQNSPPVTKVQVKLCNGDVGKTPLSAISQQIAEARAAIVSSLTRSSSSSGGVAPSEDDIMIREENLRLKQALEKLQAEVSKLNDRVARLESKLSTPNGSAGDATAAKKTAPAPADGEDDVDLFGSDEEEADAEAAKVKEERLAAYAAKKSKKPQVIAKSNVILDVKPWDDETDMKELERNVRTIVMDGLLWGSSKLVELAYGIKKLQIATVVEDDKVSVDELMEKIQDFEDFVQSVDIAAFNKL